MLASFCSVSGLLAKHTTLPVPRNSSFPRVPGHLSQIEIITVRKSPWYRGIELQADLPAAMGGPSKGDVHTRTLDIFL
jgi:hypothetical protein